MTKCYVRSAARGDSTCQVLALGAKATPACIEVTFAAAEEGGTAPALRTYDLVLQGVGRTPNGKKIAADKAGVTVTDRDFIPVDIQMRSNLQTRTHKSPNWQQFGLFAAWLLAMSSHL